ncbi:putative metal-binding protein, partial [Escherichia coli]|uniref:putative metal-binding protein n=1 Tax=Escherichia coli TaxID=562 RepID=UPI001F4B8445
IQALGPDDIPFLCLPGVREYHDHPAHTGDSWLLHRRSGEGSLHFILESIWKHGVEPLDGFNVMVQVEVRETRIHGLQ